MEIGEVVHGRGEISPSVMAMMVFFWVFFVARSAGFRWRSVSYVLIDGLGF